MAWHDMYYEKAERLVQVKRRCLALAPPVVSHATRWVVGSALIYIVRGALCAYTAAVRVARCVAHHSLGITHGDAVKCHRRGPSVWGCDVTRAFGEWRAALARPR